MVKRTINPRGFYSGTGFKELKQTGKITSFARDKGRMALTPGKRISKNGRVYWETRINRSDASGDFI